VLKQAVLLVAHGTPETAQQVPEYLRNVTGGRPIPQAVVEEIRHRYALIGHSPLTEITLEQARLAEAELARAGEPVRVYVGMRNWRPYIADALGQMRSEGVQQAAVICMAPHNSRTSVGLYRRAVEAEAQGLHIDFTEAWPAHPLLIEAFAERLRPAWTKLSGEAGYPVPVLFTAHSVPTPTVAPSPSDAPELQRLWPGAGVDPYAEEARQTAELVAARVPEIPRWWFAFQSQGASGGPWIGPTVEETLAVMAFEGVRTLLLQPIGFLCDHVEVLFDVDRVFREYAAGLGLRLERPESLNGSIRLAQAVADLARRGLARLNA
jgi:protoporphyrin/coproporphyrin ferrochelatase